jgi:hypothetical protein
MQVIKLNFLDKHVDFFPTNVFNISDEHRVHFHQEIPHDGEAIPGQVEHQYIG